MNNLKLLREMHELSQAEIASRLEVSSKAYSLYELGKRDLGTDKALILCEHYGVTLQELMGQSDLAINQNEEPSLIEKQRRQAIALLKSAYRLDKDDISFVQNYVMMTPRSRRFLHKAMKALTKGES